MAEQFKDNLQRKFHYLRLSVTDVCNFKCTYCLPDGYRSNGERNSSFLSLDEIGRVASAFAQCGTSKVRLTGGEPSLRRDFNDIIASISDVPQISKLAMTTNGYRLATHAEQWRRSGLTQLNISVDSLNSKMFHQITGENRFEQVLQGIDVSLAAGYDQVKINVVLMKEHNAAELPAFLDWIKDRPLQVRFIELMQTGSMDKFFQEQHLSGMTIMEYLLQRGWQEKGRGVTDGPARVFSHSDYVGEIGLIMPYSKDFCQTCNRLRVSAKGKLHLCLFGESGVELRDLLARDDQQSELIERIALSLQNKEATHFLHEGNTGMTPHLASIGG
ncbi:GTP 3',8-cyclase MoaA [Vibrio sp. RC27]